MRVIFLFLVFVSLGAGCTEDFVSQVQTTTDSVKSKAAEISATFAKAKAVYDILYPATPSVPPSEDPPPLATEENTSSPSPSPVPDVSTDQSL